MILLSSKAKKILIVGAKLLIVGASFYFIYSQLAHNDQLDWEKFSIIFQKNQSFTGIGFILLLSVLNRFLEILKWQNLVSQIYEISLANAARQVHLLPGCLPQTALVNMRGKHFILRKRSQKK